MSDKNFALPQKNLIFMAIGLVIIVIGFFLMIGGGPENGAFNPEIFNFRRTTLAPMIVLAGLLFEIFAIAWLPKKDRKEIK